jgi:hypothetical protein
MNQLRLLLRQERILTLEYDDASAKDCVLIAGNTIDALYSHHISPHCQASDRYSIVLYMVGALLPLVCVIVKSDNVRQTRADAIDSYQKGLSLLTQLAPNFSGARHALRRLHRIIGTAKQSIRKFRQNEAAPLDVGDFGPETQVPEIMDFLNHDLWMGTENDLLYQQLNNGSLAYGSNHVTDAECSGIADEIRAFWTDEDFSINRQG